MDIFFIDFISCINRIKHDSGSTGGIDQLNQPSSVPSLGFIIIIRTLYVIVIGYPRSILRVGYDTGFFVFVFLPNLGKICLEGRFIDYRTLSVNEGRCGYVLVF